MPPILDDTTSGIPAKWHIWRTSRKIQYLWLVTDQILIVILIGWRKFSKAQPRSGLWHFISMEFLRSFFSDIIWVGNKLWCHKMLAVFLHYSLGMVRASVFKSLLITFVRMHSNLGVPVVQINKFSRYWRRLLINRSRSAGKLDSFRFDFVSISDERGSVINDYL